MRNGYPKALLLSFSLLALAFPCTAEVDLVEVVKSKRRMYLIEKQVIVAEYHIALGKEPKGHKQQEGDQRTPEGLYILDYVKRNSAFYLSMHISYPNSHDKQQAKLRNVDPGGLIMIHGQKEWHPDFAPIAQQFDWTDGCIAISNQDMEQFIEMVKVGTPIYIRW